MTPKVSCRDCANAVESMHERHREMGWKQCAVKLASPDKGVAMIARASAVFDAPRRCSSFKSQEAIAA